MIINIGVTTALCVHSSGDWTGRNLILDEGLGLHVSYGNIGLESGRHNRKTQPPCVVTLILAVLSAFAMGDHGTF